MRDLLALVTIMIWPVIPIFWIPVHFATDFFRKLGLLTYVIPFIIWLPLAYLVCRHRVSLLRLKAELPLILNVVGIPLFICGSLLHVWTARLLGIWGIIGVPEIHVETKENLVTHGPFSIVRHPTYLAHTLIFSGVFLITESVVVGVITVIDFLTVNTVIIPLEEEELLKRFGDDYTLYKERIPSRFFPRINRVNRR
jgi:protein-S-isoprenylcysteine O-methyltransferase Ste14